MLQGKLKLSQLLDNFVKDYYRMKKAILHVRQEKDTKLRKSHSFDSQIVDQKFDAYSNLLPSQNIDNSIDFNTVSYKRYSGIVGPVNTSSLLMP